MSVINTNCCVVQSFLIVLFLYLVLCVFTLIFIFCTLAVYWLIFWAATFFMLQNLVACRTVRLEQHHWWITQAKISVFKYFTAFFSLVYPGITAWCLMLKGKDGEHHWQCSCGSHNSQVRIHSVPDITHYWMHFYFVHTYSYNVHSNFTALYHKHFEVFVWISYYSYDP